MQRLACPAVRLALIGGVYGNLPALEACLEDARRAGCGAVVGTGDYLGFCGHAPQVLGLLRSAGAILVAGNHERSAAAGLAVCGCGHRDREDEAAACAAAARQADGLAAADLAGLAAMPHPAVVDTPAGSLLVAHGSPDLINEFLFASTLDPVRLVRWLDRHQAQAMACGHGGLPWIVALPDGRLAVNGGAAGRPDHDDDPAVHYAVIDLSGRPAAEIRRVVYDHRAWARELAQDGIDERFILPLLTGRWTHGLSALPPAELRQRSAKTREGHAA